MARRSTEAAPQPEAVSTEQPTTEAPVEASVTESPEAPEVTEGTEAQAKAAEPDLSAFEAAVATSVEARDEATGEIPAESVEPVTTAYRELDGLKAKNRAKAFLQAGVKDGMEKMNLQLARAYMQLSDALMTPAAKKSAESTPTDPTEAFTQKVAALRVAEQLVTSQVPEGVAEDWADKTSALVSESLSAAQNYLAWVNSTAEDKGEEPEVSAVVRAAVKLSQGKAGRITRASSGGGSSYEGPRRSIAAHIENAFAGVEPGTFLTIAQIRATKSEEYGDELPSAGAISARLFPPSGKCTVEGIEPGTSAEGNKGATKL